MLLPGEEEKEARMEGFLKPRLMVCGRGIEAWVGILYERADGGDKEAERALEKLRDAFEFTVKVLGGGEIKEDEYLGLVEATRILEKALEGSSEYPREVLLRIARQAVEDCRKLGIEPPDTSFLYEGQE
jgi:hypothetical protein